MNQRATVNRILQAGASKVFISSRKADACDEAVKALNALPNLAPGAKAIAIPADSSKVSGVEHLVAEVCKHTDRLDILVANAGATWGEKLETHSDASFAKVMDLNVKGVFNTIRLFVPILEKSGTVDDPSRVLITSSIAGRGLGTLGQQGTYGYSASKAAVLHLGRNLAIELGPRHISVNSICPGFFPSKMSNGLISIAGGADKIGKKNPLGRLGRAEDMAGIVVYLCSRAGSHVNGEGIAVDGGSMWVTGELAMAGGSSKL